MRENVRVSRLNRQFGRNRVWQESQGLAAPAKDGGRAAGGSDQRCDWIKRRRIAPVSY